MEGQEVDRVSQPDRVENTGGGQADAFADVKVSGEADSSGDTADDGKRRGDTKVGLTLRILVAAYVLYLAYSLIQGFGETSGNDRIFIGIAIVVFLIAGGAILILSGRKLIKKDYIDGNDDAE